MVDESEPVFLVTTRRQTLTPSHTCLLELLGLVAFLKEQAFLYLIFEVSGEVPHCQLSLHLFSPRPFPFLLQSRGWVA